MRRWFRQPVRRPVLGLVLLVLAALLVPLSAEAQTGSVSGRVTDAVTGLLIANVPVAAIPTNWPDDGYSSVTGQYFSVALPSEDDTTNHVRLRAVNAQGASVVSNQRLITVP